VLVRELHVRATRVPATEGCDFLALESKFVFELDSATPGFGGNPCASYDAHGNAYK